MKTKLMLFRVSAEKRLPVHFIVQIIFSGPLRELGSLRAILQL